ncbi:MAG: interferon-related developmental regulator family protein [Monoraphidium minutum]|nr:MAG: interferon-related developmental regulator family protein [Monoraphidium minutum]
MASLGGGPETEDGASDEFAEALEMTYESRGSTREKGWERLAALLRNSVREVRATRECYQNAATITGRCQAALKKGSAVEATYAAAALALHVLTLGDADESLFQSLQPELLRAAQHGKAAASRLAAADALAVCCFVLADDEASTHSAMAGLRSLWSRRDGGAALRAAALRGWTFLFTSLNALPDGGAVEALLPALAGLLHDGDVEVRAAAGEAIAVVYHACGLDELDSILENGDDDDEDGDDEEGGSGSGSAGGVSGLSEVVGRMRDLATNRGDRQRRSKRERAALRGAFRDITRAIEDGAVRETKIKLRHGDVITINSLNGSVSMGYMRRFLAGGFQAHLQSNPLLHAVFGYEPLSERPGRLTALEKRAFRSPSSAGSKQRTQARKGQRAHKGTALDF